MKHNDNTTPEQGHSANMLLYAVAPTPKLSTDGIALDGAVVSRGNGIGATSEVYLMDCIVGMKHYPDKYFDLAVVDPPYGLSDKLTNGGTWASKYKKGDADWDIKPTMEYFVELFRVSKNQIIWGANYFNGLPECRCFLIWDKVAQLDTLADCEFAWTSFDKNAKIFRHVRNTSEQRIHITQKPVKLYE